MMQEYCEYIRTGRVSAPRAYVPALEDVVEFEPVPAGGAQSLGDEEISPRRAVDVVDVALSPEEERACDRWMEQWLQEHA